MNAYTENLNDIITFARERDMTIKLLQSWGEHGLPDDFYEEGVKIAFNRSSGYVFLTNEDYQVAMLTDDGTLESYYNTPYSGHEGFLSDLVEYYITCPDDWEEDDIEYLNDLLEINNKTLDDYK